MNIDPMEPGQADPAAVAMCHFGAGHDWIDATTILDTCARYVCLSCGAIGRDEDLLPPTAWRESW